MNSCTELWGCCLLKKFDDMFRFFWRKSRAWWTDRETEFLLHTLFVLIVTWYSRSTFAASYQKFLRFCCCSGIKHILFDMTALLPCCEICANICWCYLMWRVVFVMSCRMKIRNWRVRFQVCRRNWKRVKQLPREPRRNKNSFSRKTAMMSPSWKVHACC